MRDLTDPEAEVTDLYLALCDNPEVYDKVAAAQYALSVLPDPDEEFVEWLSEGLLRKVAVPRGAPTQHMLLRVAYLDENTHPLTEDLT
jgi:hypothetical protein